VPSSSNDSKGLPADTIAAIATPLGEGGIAMIRLSGPQSLAIADGGFRPVPASSLSPEAAPTHTIHFGRITGPGGWSMRFCSA
jgi:tRNA modification GTPase